MSYKYFTVDVFTDKMFGGNQLAVFPNATGISDDQMMSITREFNFSETVFVLPPVEKEHSRRVRIFTPGRELPFAGHPTVGTAFVLAATGEIPFAGGEERVVLEEGVGPVTVLIRGEPGKPNFTRLTTARLPERKDSPISVRDLARLLGLDESAVLNDRYRPEIYSCGIEFLCVPLKNIEALASARVQTAIWDELSTALQVPEMYLVTQESWSSKKAEGISDEIVRARMYGPGLGVPEDPATGSAAAALAGFLSARADASGSFLHWTIFQGVEMGRPSRIELEVDRQGGEITAVHVGGQSVLVSSGTFYL